MISCTPAYTQFAEYKTVWAVAISRTDLNTGETRTSEVVPRVAISITTGVITINSEESQQYTIVSHGQGLDTEQEKSVSWICRDEQNTPVLVTLHVLLQKKLMFLRVRDANYQWVYALQ
jgi:hypothetical protein